MKNKKHAAVFNTLVTLIDENLNGMAHVAHSRLRNPAVQASTSHQQQLKGCLALQAEELPSLRPQQLEKWGRLQGILIFPPLLLLRDDDGSRRR